jgi:hypothetical protein
MFEIFMREYVRLEFERSQLDAEKPNDMSKNNRLQNMQSEIRRIELERFIAEQSGSKPAAGAERWGSLKWLNRGFGAVRHFFHFLGTRFVGDREAVDRKTHRPE